MMGVSTGSASEHRNPQPCALTINTMHFSPNGRFRSRLITLAGISTRTRVLRRVALEVRTSIGQNYPAVRNPGPAWHLKVIVSDSLAVRMVTEVTHHLKPPRQPPNWHDFRIQDRF
jgi:hypothetical protein